MRNKPLPVFFLLRMSLGRLAPLPAAYPLPVPLSSSDAVYSPLPALLSAYHGVGRNGVSSLSPSPARLAVAACLLGRWICVCSDCDLPACLRAAICVGNVLAELYI